jgi:peptide/nickel transport system ATP-binding protein
MADPGARRGWRRLTPPLTESLQVRTSPPPFELLEVRDLRIHFPTEDGLVKAVDGLSFRLDRSHTLGIVRESGSGKSVTSLGIVV